MLPCTVSSWISLHCRVLLCSMLIHSSFCTPHCFLMKLLLKKKKRPAPSSYSLDGQPKSPRNYVSLQATQDRPSISSYIGSYDSERSRFDIVQVTNRTRSSTPPSLNEVFRESSHFPQNNAKR